MSPSRQRKPLGPGALVRAGIGHTSPRCSLLGGGECEQLQLMVGGGLPAKCPAMTHLPGFPVAAFISSESKITF